MTWLKTALYPAALLLIPGLLCLGLSAGAADEETSFTYFTYAMWWGTAALTWLCVIAISFIVWWGIGRVP